MSQIEHRKMADKPMAIHTKEKAKLQPEGVESGRRAMSLDSYLRVMQALETTR